MKSKITRRRKQKRKWKYTKHARRRRCLTCPKKLKPDEHFHCEECWEKITSNNLPWYE